MVLKQKLRSIVIGISALLVFSVILYFEPHASTIAPWDDHPIQDYYYLLFTDMVVHGVVLDVKEEAVPIEEVNKKVASQFAGKFTRITKVTLSVTDILKGWVEPKTVNFIYRAGVRATALNEVGSEIIVGLTLNDDLLGGSFEMVLAEALYVRSGDVWISQGEVKGGRTHTLSELTSKIESVGIEAIAREATAVFEGTVLEISEAPYRDEGKEYGMIRDIRIRVDNIVDGSINGEITLKTVAYGNFWPDWRNGMPKHISVGDKYYIFAKDAEGIWFAVGGVNGFFLKKNDRLYYDDRFPLPFVEKELSQKIRRIRGGDI